MMSKEDREALYMIRERNGRAEILRVLDAFKQIEDTAEENGLDPYTAVDDYLRLP